MKLGFLILTFSLIGGFATFANDKKCTKCTTSSISENNTGKCNSKINGLGDSCTSDCSNFWGPICNCDGDVEVDCSTINGQ